MHWDGIKMAPLVGKGKDVERLPVVVTGEGIEQFLGAGIVPNGTGKAQAAEMLRQLKAWGIAVRVCSRCSDTTSSNRGPYNGAAILVETALGKELLFCACRHHSLELVPKALFEQLIERSSCPDLGILCKKFAEAWPSIDQTKFKPVTDANLPEILRADGMVEKIILFCRNTLKVGDHSPLHSPFHPFHICLIF